MSATPEWWRWAMDLARTEKVVDRRDVDNVAIHMGDWGYTPFNLDFDGVFGGFVHALTVRTGCTETTHAYYRALRAPGRKFCLAHVII